MSHRRRACCVLLSTGFVVSSRRYQAGAKLRPDRLRRFPRMPSGKPDFTGLWQVSGRNLLTYRQMCELDVTYVRSWSLWLDIYILLQTVIVVLNGRGAK